MSKRAERRARTETKIKARMRQVKHSNVKSWDPIPGICKKMSPFDCGKKNCGVCRGSKKDHDRMKLRAIRNAELRTARGETP